MNKFFLFVVLAMSCLSCDRTEIDKAAEITALIGNIRTFKQIKIFAHRGYWKTPGSYENTLTSISKASEIGIHGVELDVRISADKVLYLFHDPKLEDGRFIGEMTSTEIDKVILPNGDKIPRLNEALGLLKNYPELLMNLEIKGDVPSGYSTIFVHRLNDAVMSSGFSDRVFFSSLSINLLIISKKYNPHVKTQFIAYEKFDINRAVTAKVDMINYKYSLLTENPNLISIANSNNIDVCTGAGDLLNLLKVINSNWNVKYINTDEPDRVMQVYK